MSDADHHFMRFDEETNLKMNPDVRDAVRNGSFPSGWQHFVTCGYKENRPGVPSDVGKALQDVMEYSPSEVPPEHLRERVHGDESQSGFEYLGRIVSSDSYLAIKSIIELNENCNVLDFGCGCGRVIRYFQRFAENSKLYGTDIDNEAITWCQQNLSHIGQFIRNNNVPPLPFDDDFFDFVYSISIFTHLPEDMQFSWLEELRRVTKPGGYLILTTHGEELFHITSKKEVDQFKENGFYYAVGDGTEGLPDFYQTAFHTIGYVYANWGNFFEIKNIIKKGIAGHQDLILCRKPD